VNVIGEELYRGRIIARRNGDAEWRSPHRRGTDLISSARDRQVRRLVAEASTALQIRSDSEKEIILRFTRRKELARGAGEVCGVREPLDNSGRAYQPLLSRRLVM
jgi:hypothetical protein